MINWTNITSIADFPAAANTSTGGTFWLGMLMMIFIVLLILFMAYGFEVAILTASTISLFIAMPLAYYDLIAWGYAALFIGIDLFMFMYITYSSQKKVS